MQHSEFSFRRLALRFMFVLAFAGSCSVVQAQRTEDPTDVLATLVEDIIERLGDESDFDYNTLFERLELYYNKPLDLNKADAEDFAELGILTDLQLGSLVRHRNETGDLLSVYELQAVPNFDLATIQQLVPFVKVSSGLDDYNVPFMKMVT